MSEEYAALLQKVDAFCQQAETQAGDALACAPGCSACCKVWLTVSAVEAQAIDRFIAELPADARHRLAERGRRERERQQEGKAEASCPMLDADERCSIYPARPLLCRTQGLALRYPAGTVPSETVRFRAADGSDVVACPLNYTERKPDGAETLDADVLNTLLALVNRRFADATGRDPSARISLLDLAAGANGEG